MQIIIIILMIFSLDKIQTSLTSEATLKWLIIKKNQKHQNTWEQIKKKQSVLKGIIWANILDRWSLCHLLFFSLPPVQAFWLVWSCATPSTSLATWATSPWAAPSTPAPPRCSSTSAASFTSTRWRGRSTQTSWTTCRTTRCCARWLTDRESHVRRSRLWSVQTKQLLRWWRWLLLVMGFEQWGSSSSSPSETRDNVSPV